MKNLNLSVFDDVECELDSKIQRHISMAKEVFQVDDIKKRFCKKAYYARLVIVRSLTLDGLTPKYIADGLGLTERTVKRLIVESQRALVDREDYKLMINEFYKQYYEKKAS
jgi:DNA-binding NarL/FixJ family response regulator